MQLRNSDNHFFLPNETYTLPDFTIYPDNTYLLIVSATFASTACYIGILSIVGERKQELVLRSELITANISSSHMLEIAYNPPENIGAQALHINIIRLS